MSYVYETGLQPAAEILRQLLSKLALYPRYRCSTHLLSFALGSFACLRLKYSVRLQWLGRRYLHLFLMVEVMSQSYGALQTSHWHSFLARRLSPTAPESQSVHQDLLGSIEISWRLLHERGWSLGPKSTGYRTKLQEAPVLHRKGLCLWIGRERHRCWEQSTSRSKLLWRWCFACLSI